MPKRQSVIVIVGPTASGKSDLAVQIAQKLKGEVISADSRQVYKGLDIGTGKITPQEMQGIPHHLLDVASPKRRFSVARFQKLAKKELKNILKRGNTPIIAGGTGFYIDAIVDGFILPQVPPNTVLRNKLTKKSASQLFKTLKKLDSKRAKDIDPHNKVRLIRTIEIATALGNVPKMKKQPSKYNFIKIGLRIPQDTHQKLIAKRCKQMLEGGLLKEIAKLKAYGISDQRLKEFGFEYNNPNLSKLILGNNQYAKRQMTWFKRDKKIKWFEIKNKPTTTDFRKIMTYIKSKL